MESKLKKAYSEVWEVLKMLDFRYAKMLPSAIVDAIKLNRDATYRPSIADSHGISREALVIISILNVKFWERDSEVVRNLRNVYSKNEAKWRLEQGFVC